MIPGPVLCHHEQRQPITVRTPRSGREVVVVILAGGQGERLSILSAQRAKPAVPFGGKYRIIDFALSNCVNSGLFDVLVLTQYRPVSLHDHIGTGKPWDLDRQYAVGVRMISPYLGRRGADWYRGTADAVYQNISELRELRPEHTMILGGDHIYTMDYRAMIDKHVRSKADVTIGLQNVPVEDAHRFGIATTDRSGRITDWQEKPKKSAATLASMGFYIFKTDVLIERLLADAQATGSKHDFGGDIVPKMIADGDRVYGYRFDGYWRDVGTIQSYHDAHMELLAEPPALDLYDRGWPIHTQDRGTPAGPDRIGRARGAVAGLARLPHPRARRALGAVARRAGRGGRHRARLDRAVRRRHRRRRGRRPRGDRQGGRDRAERVRRLRRRHGAQRDRAGRLNTGITLVGKRAQVPYGVRMGRNCRIDPDVDATDFKLADLPSGTTVTHRHTEQ